MKPRLLALVPAAALAACTEDLMAPGRCPDFCPPGQVTVIDTILGTAIERDSAFRGYVRPHEAALLLVANLPPLDSRAIFRTFAIAPSYRLEGDTTSWPISGVDSLQLRFIVTRHDANAANLRLHLYRLPLAMDSTTTYDDVPFTDSVRSVHLDSLLHLPGLRDPVTGDSVVVDTATQNVTVLLKLDSAHAPYVDADAGKLAFGFRVTADSLASVALGSLRGAGGPSVTWYLRVDSAGTPANVPPQFAGTDFDHFVFQPPAPALDSTLAVGGVPSARSLLRVRLPRALRDSGQTLRATLILVPASPARGAPADSFYLYAQPVVADFGAKSPLARITDSVLIKIGATDTVRIEMTNIVRVWSVDTLVATALMLFQAPEGGSFAEIRFYPSVAAAFRPVVHVTFAPRFPFGVR